MVLNPYTDYAEMLEICRMVLEKEPKVVAQRDGFKLSPFAPWVQNVPTWPGPQELTFFSSFLFVFV